MGRDRRRSRKGRQADALRKLNNRQQNAQVDASDQIDLATSVARERIQYGRGPFGDGDAVAARKPLTDVATHAAKPPGNQGQGAVVSDCPRTGLNSVRLTPKCAALDRQSFRRKGAPRWSAPWL